MATAEAMLGKSLDAIIEENRSKASGMGGRGRGGRGTGRAPARSGAGGSAASGEGKSRGGGGRRTGSRVTSRLSGIAGLPQARRGGAGKQQAVVVGGTRYVKAQVPGVSSGGVTKAGGRKKGGGGGAAAAFAHDDRTGMGGSLDDSYGMGGGAGAGTSSRMGSRLQRDSGAGITGRWQHDMYDPRDSAPAPRRAGRLAGAAPSQPTRVLIGNLDFKVTQQDLEELFMPIGEILSAAIDYDRTDRPVGTGQVVFKDRKDAEQALAAYNGVKLDNRALQLKIDDARLQILSSGKSVQFPGGSAPARGGGLASRALQQAIPRQSAAPARSGGRGRGGSRLRSVVSGSRPQRTAKDLNAELDDYMQE